MFKRTLLALSLGLFFAPSAFADEVLVTDEMPAEETTVSADSAVLCGCGGGSWGGVYVNVNTMVSAEVGTINLYGNFYVDNAETRLAAVQELNAAYRDIKETLSKYGTVRRTGIYTYSDWEYTNMFDGSISVKVVLDKASQVEAVENLLYENSFENWREVMLVSASATEKEAVSTLKDLLADKKSVYEELLSENLGAVSNVNVYNWVDSNSYDADTNEVDVTVYADVTYSIEN